MPISTIHYFLEAFLDGDAYSAFADRRRFQTVDNQLNMLATIIGDGRIDGWEIQESTFPDVIITQGNGIIDKYYTNTFDDQVFELAANGKFFFYAQRRVGITGTVGPKSDIESIAYNDSGAPGAPADFDAEAPDPFTVTCTWTANTEVDMDHYELERSEDGGSEFILLEDEIDKDTTFFQDDTADEDITYIYRLFAVDQSGFKSVAATDTVMTPLSTDPPPNPLSVEIKQSEAAINLLWDRPPTLPFVKLQHYKIIYSELDTEGTVVSTESFIVNKNLYNDRIDNLKVGVTYKVTIKTIDTKDRASTGVTQDIIPQPTPAPRDPEGIAFSETDSGDGVEVNLSWTSGDTPYDPATSFRYRVYVTVGWGTNLPESLGIDVPLGESELAVSLYTFDLLTYLPIPYSTLVTFRITSVNESGFESFGSYIRFVTDNFIIPLPLKNVAASFDFDTGNLVVTWENLPSTDDVQIVINNDDLDDPYVLFVEVVNKFLGKATKFVFEGDLNHRYQIFLTPFDINGIAGPTSSVTALSFIPTGLELPSAPTGIETKTGDRQIRLTWNETETIYGDEYNLYKKSGPISFTASDWTLLETMPRGVTAFIDYGLDNDETYSYYITTVDVYNRESLHLPDGALNLNFVEAIPKKEGLLTEPENVQANLSGLNVVLTWESLLEEFDGFTIYRSINNLYNFIEVATVDRNTFTYTDITLPLIDGTIFYYVVDKTINDADIVVQTTDTPPEDSIFIGCITTLDSTFGDTDVSARRDIKDLLDPLAEYTSTFLLPHKHREIDFNDPSRIDLNPELIVTNWDTVDGRIFTTSELDIMGETYIVKVDGKFPTVFFTVDPVLRRIIFSEPITTVDEDGNITGSIPDIEMRVLGIEETQGILDAFRFDDIHARQIQFGTVNKEQLPPIGHEGRIFEVMLPKRFLLQRFSNHTFVVPEESTDTTKNFGDGTTFYDLIESDGQIEEVVDFDLQDDFEIVAFRRPSFSPTTFLNLKQTPYDEQVLASLSDAYAIGVGVWINGSDELLLGKNVSGTTNTTYLKIPVDVPLKSRVTSAKIVFTSKSTQITEKCRTKIAVYDPDGFSHLTTFALPLPTSLEVFGDVQWEIPPWTAEEFSDNTTSPDFRELVQQFIDSSTYLPGNNMFIRIEEDGSLSDTGAFREAYSYDGDSTKAPMLEITYAQDTAEVDSVVGGFQSNKSYHFNFEFEDTKVSRWVRVTTFDTELSPNPIIDLTKRIRFRVLLEKGSIYIALGVREIDPETFEDEFVVGGNGGTIGPIEWVAVDNIVADSEGNIAPRGVLVEASSEWQEVDIDIPKTTVTTFPDDPDSNAILATNYGVLEHLAFTINPDDPDATGPFDIYIDEIQQVDDVIVSGTSQGIQISPDFGSTWELVRYTDTPIHKFYRAQNNKFLWAISASEVLLATDPAFWFTTSGTAGIQYIRDIVEDSAGNMFISTEKGVYWLEIALIQNFASWRQTKPINAFSSDAYGMYVNNISSGLDEVWVSTEIGIYKTTDQGDTWVDTGMTTGGLVAYQIEDISTDPNVPNLIAINRKHVLRKLGLDNNFKIIANFEDQHKIFGIWNFAYFSGRLYVSTEKGVYINNLDELFIAGDVDIDFEKTLDGLDTNRFVRIAFGLSVIEIEDGSKQLFIGQESRLMVANESNFLTQKIEYAKTELPSFFRDDEEILTGYIYNSFNNVVVFREPEQVNKLITAAHIPRRVWIPVNEGWAQTNPFTEIFVYVNGFPVWLDFQKDEPFILGELQLLQGKLDTLPTLTSFNSLVPDSQTFLQATQDDITQILQGGEDEDGNAIPDVTGDNVVKFMEDYTRFLSLVTEAVRNNNDLSLPKIQLRGINPDDRPAGTKAEQLEIKDNFKADNATGILIDTVAGEVDFIQAFANATTAEEKTKFTFDKFDHMHATIFGTHVKNVGELTHRELEDQMEDINSGLTSDLVGTVSANLIQLGIFLEGRNNFMFDRFDVQNIQSKYLNAYTNDWYDILNSTVDYDLITGVANIPSGRYATSTHFFTEDPYFNNKIWIGTDNDIAQFVFTDGDLELESVVRPGNGLNALHVWDIFARTDDEVYVIAAEKDTGKSRMFLTQTFGATWTELQTINLPFRFYKIGIINGNLFVTSDEGIFYNDNSFGTWFESDVVPSEQVSEGGPELVAAKTRTFNIALDTFLIVENDRYFYRSGQAIEFLALANQITNNNVSIVSKIERYKNLTFIATDRGLYDDGNTVLGSGVNFSLQTEMEETATDSSQVAINDIAQGEDALYCCGNNGKIYRYFSIGPGEPNEWRRYQVPDFGSIHKMILRETSSKDYMIVISYDKIKVVDVTPDSGVFG